MNSNRPDFDALVLRESPDAVVVVTLGGEILHWNSGAEAIYGYTRAEAIGRALAELIVPPQAAGELDRVYDALRANGVVTFQTLRRRKDGTLVYVDVSSKQVRGADGADPVVLLMQKDVTQLRVLHDANLVEARFGDLLESTPDGVVLVGVTGHIVYANQHTGALFGYAPAELRGKPVEVLLPPRFRDMHLAHRARYFAQPRTRAMGAGLELFGLRRDGSEFPVEISLSPLRFEDTVFVMSAIRDISDRKRIENELREKNLQLEAAMRAKDRFLATMSHELRTPLNAVIGFTGTLLMKLAGPLNEKQERQLTTVQTSARHLLSLINDLLDLAKIEAGSFDLEFAPTPCGEVIEEVVAGLRPLAEQKQLELRVLLPPRDVVLHTNRRALSQILINLASNAIKFTDAGGVIVALAQHGDAPRAVTEISVTDTGCGIRPEDMAKLFAAFTQLDDRPTRRYEGTGLGLHLSGKLAGLLGARITCESEFGRGSRFTLRFEPRPGTGER